MAHVVSMSSGEFKITGASATYELQVALYEARDLKDPEHALLDRIHFSSGDVEARILTRSCVTDEAMLTCRATYLFNRDVDRLKIECELYKALVSNHVHMLRATMDGRTDQAFFDISFQSAELRFRPPAFWESLMRDIGNGFWRACAAIASLLFLVSIVVAARGTRELGMLALMFAGGELAAALLAGAHQLSPRFLETASALTVAYLAIEVLLLPKAGQRWLVVAVLGAFHGLYFALFLSDATHSGGFLTGVVMGELVVLGVLRLTAMALVRMFPGVNRQWWTRLFALLLMLTGISWFVVRMVS
jgi:hypothetical protein